MNINISNPYLIDKLIHMCAFTEIEAEISCPHMNVCNI